MALLNTSALLILPLLLLLTVTQTSSRAANISINQVRLTMKLTLRQAALGPIVPNTLHQPFVKRLRKKRNYSCCFTRCNIKDSNPCSCSGKGTFECSIKSVNGDAWCLPVQ